MIHPLPLSHGPLMVSIHTHTHHTYTHAHTHTHTHTHTHYAHTYTHTHTVSGNIELKIPCVCVCVCVCVCKSCCFTSGEVFSVGAFNTLRLCDKTGVRLTHNTQRINDVCVYMYVHCLSFVLFNYRSTLY